MSISIELIFSGDEYFSHFLKEFRDAKTQILIEAYLFNLDPIGVRILNELALAAGRGVQVRLLVDGVGSFNALPALYTECKKRGISFRVYHPVPLSSMIFPRINWKNLGRLLFIFRRLNKRNHRKMAIVDSTTIFIGSFNISKVHSEEFSGDNAWRDSAVKIQCDGKTPVSHIVTSAFLEAWRTSRYFSGRHLRSFVRRRWKGISPFLSIIRLNNRPIWRFRHLRDLNRRFKSAQSRILITNAYFLPRRSILRSLRQTSLRNVEVCLLLPYKTDLWFMRLASRLLYLRLLKDGIRVFEYQKRVLHAKTLIVDNWATVGSYNLNHRSLVHDLEIEAVLENPIHIQKLFLQWQVDLRESKEITLKDLGQWPFYLDWMSRMIYWFRYWL